MVNNREQMTCVGCSNAIVSGDVACLIAGRYIAHVRCFRRAYEASGLDIDKGRESGSGSPSWRQELIRALVDNMDMMRAARGRAVRAREAIVAVTVEGIGEDVEYLDMFEEYSSFADGADNPKDRALGMEFLRDAKRMARESVVERQSDVAEIGRAFHAAADQWENLNRIVREIIAALLAPESAPNDAKE